MPSDARRAALAAIVNHRPQAGRARRDGQSLVDIYATNVFGDQAMQERLPSACYRSLRKTIEAGKKLEPAIADMVATAMKEWAIERGATHYTHWFQPMTGLTAEKHDSFLEFSQGRLILEFSGKSLIKGEPDASSFPHGGVRSTFEARGYTAWDPTSPAFVREGANGATLCIPTAFCSWTGEALDKKTPLLRSTEALNRSACRALDLLGHSSTHVHSTLGIEQEFFVIDRHWFLSRPDLLATGRTVIGARPPKGQELEDHYFGTMDPRVLAYIQDVEWELWKLGVPVKTRHNEVAPSQFEMAPLFERATVATDHNLITMEVLRQVACDHNLVCLLHEKPFAGVNGSGKHNNWSLATEDGENLLDPGETPQDNARFVFFLTAIIRAVDMHADVLRASIALAGNDHRLGANEAPPAIMSIYLGRELDHVVRTLAGLEQEGKKPSQTTMKLGASALPPLPRDSTDRNRTSPFAFTGNKFEFRAAGASQSPASPNICLNTIVSDSVEAMVDAIEGRISEGESKDDAMQGVIQETLARHYRVVFNGDNYSEEWLSEAESRGLLNLRNTPEALATVVSEKNVELYERAGVLTKPELMLRSTVLFERYCKAISIEAQSLLGIASTSVLPAAIKHQGLFATAIAATKACGLDTSVQEEALQTLSGTLDRLMKALKVLQTRTDAAEAMEADLSLTANTYRDEVIPVMDEVREACDSLETQVDDDLWPLPKYREMLFVH